MLASHLYPFMGRKKKVLAELPARTPVLVNNFGRYNRKNATSVGNSL